MSGSGFDCPQPDSPVRYDSRRNYRAGGDNRPATTNTLVEDITTWMARAGIDNPRGELPTPDHGAFARFLEGAEKLLLQSTRKKRSALTEKEARECQRTWCYGAVLGGAPAEATRTPCVSTISSKTFLRNLNFHRRGVRALLPAGVHGSCGVVIRRARLHRRIRK